MKIKKDIWIILISSIVSGAISALSLIFIPFYNKWAHQHGFLNFILCVSLGMLIITIGLQIFGDHPFFDTKSIRKRRELKIQNKVLKAFLTDEVLRNSTFIKQLQEKLNENNRSDGARHQK